MDAPLHNDGIAETILPLRRGPQLVSRKKDVVVSVAPVSVRYQQAHQASRLQLVPQTTSATQEHAHRIVREVEQEQLRRWEAMRPLPPLRSQDFWNTLPLPEYHRETPLTVVRRLMHTLFSPAKTA